MSRLPPKPYRRIAFGLTVRLRALCLSALCPSAPTWAFGGCFAFGAFALSTFSFGPFTGVSAFGRSGCRAPAFGILLRRIGVPAARSHGRALRRPGIRHTG